MKNPILIAVLVILLALVGVAGFRMLTDDEEPAPTTTTQTTPATDNTEDSTTATTPTTEPEATTTDEVEIEDFAYTPSTITVKKGTTVTWTNKDAMVHTVTSDSGSQMDSGNMSEGDTYSVTFDEAGTFTYHCVPHPQMKGTVIVTE